MVGVAGVPGAGMSMSCALLAEELRKARAKSEGGLVGWSTEEGERA